MCRGKLPAASESTWSTRRARCPPRGRLAARACRGRSGGRHRFDLDSARRPSRALPSAADLPDRSRASTYRHDAKSARIVTVARKLRPDADAATGAAPGKGEESRLTSILPFTFHARARRASRSLLDGKDLDTGMMLDAQPTHQQLADDLIHDMRLRGSAASLASSSASALVGRLNHVNKRLNAVCPARKRVGNRRPPR